MSDSTVSAKKPEFTGWRGIFWPIHGFELKKFLPMALMMAFVLFNYTVLRNLKDSLVVTAPGSGAEVLVFLKTWFVLPSAILFIMIYAKMSNILSKEKLFYWSVIPFIIFFASFAVVLYPSTSVLHPSVETVTALQERFPNVRYFFSIWGNWTYALFFIMAELWGSVVLSLTFWQFANDVTRVAEAKRFYALFGILGNFAVMASGFLISHFSKATGGMQSTVSSLMALVVGGGLLVLGCRWYMQNKVLTDPRFFDPSEVKKPKKAKAKMSLKDSFVYLVSSRYLAFICLLVLGYGMAINLVEATWKSQIKAQFPSPQAYNAFMGNFTMISGMVTVVFMVAGSNILRKFSWLTAAMATPLIILATGCLFFFLVLARDSETLTGMLSVVGWTPVLMAVIVGTAQNVLSKGTKYSLFDPTKEMSYIPLDDELKVKGKAAVDVIGGRMGKSGGAFVQMALITLTGGTQLTILPYIAGIFLFVMMLWIMAVRGLNVQFTNLTSQREKEKAEADALQAANQNSSQFSASGSGKPSTSST